MKWERLCLEKGVDPEEEDNEIEKEEEDLSYEQRRQTDRPTDWHV